MEAQVDRRVRHLLSPLDHLINHGFDIWLSCLLAEDGVNC